MTASAAIVAASSAILLTALPVALWGRPRHGVLTLDADVYLLVADLALIAVAILGVPSFLRRARRRDLPGGSAMLGLYALSEIVALGAHPTAFGAEFALRLVATFLLALTIAGASGFEAQLVLGSLAALTLFEGGVAVAQTALGGPLGWTWLGELTANVQRFGRLVGGQGTLEHPYILAGLVLTTASALLWPVSLVDRPRRFLAAAAITIAPLAVTFSRAGLLAGALVVVVLAIGGTRGKRWAFTAASVTVIAVGVPIAFAREGWSARALQTVDSTSLNDVSTGRAELVRQSWVVARTDPWLGVGPGRYRTVLRRARDAHLERTDGQARPVHVVPLLAFAEAGLVAGLATVALLVVLGIKAVRAGPWTTAVYVALLPFWLLDHFLYTFPQGIVLAGVWVGGLDLLSERSRWPATSGWSRDRGANERC